MQEIRNSCNTLRTLVVLEKMKAIEGLAEEFFSLSSQVLIGLRIRREAGYSAVRNIGDRWCTEERTDEAPIVLHFA